MGPYAKPSVEHLRPPSGTAATTAAVVVPESHGQWRTVRNMMPHHEVGAQPPDHPLDGICLLRLEAGERVTVQGPVKKQQPDGMRAKKFVLTLKGTGHSIGHFALWILRGGRPPVCF